MNATPTRKDIQAATGKMMSDILAPDLTIIFCGINPSLYSVAVGHHFARPGNRFWEAIHFAGFTDRLLQPVEDRELLYYGYGLTNIADRATARADELTSAELIIGHQQLAAKVAHYCPKVLAVLGISAYRIAFARPKALIGRQPELIHDTIIWVLPNPSGLNAHYQLDDLTRSYQELLVATMKF